MNETSSLDHLHHGDPTLDSEAFSDGPSLSDSHDVLHLPVLKPNPYARRQQPSPPPPSIPGAPSRRTLLLLRKRNFSSAGGPPEGVKPTRFSSGNRSSNGTGQLLNSAALGGLAMGQAPMNVGVGPWDRLGPGGLPALSAESAMMGSQLSTAARVLPPGAVIAAVSPDDIVGNAVAIDHKLKQARRRRHTDDVGVFVRTPAAGSQAKPSDRDSAHLQPPFARASEPFRRDRRSSLGLTMTARGEHVSAGGVYAHRHTGSGPGAHPMYPGPGQGPTATHRSHGSMTPGRAQLGSWSRMPPSRTFNNGHYHAGQTLPTSQIEIQRALLLGTAGNHKNHSFNMGQAYPEIDLQRKRSSPNVLNAAGASPTVARLHGDASLSASPIAAPLTPPTARLAPLEMTVAGGSPPATRAKHRGSSGFDRSLGNGTSLGSTACLHDLVIHETVESPHRLSSAMTVTAAAAPESKPTIGPAVGGPLLPTSSAPTGIPAPPGNPLTLAQRLRTNLKRLVRRSSADVYLMSAKQVQDAHRSAPPFPFTGGQK